MMLKNLLNLRFSVCLIALLTVFFSGGNVFAQNACDNSAGTMPEGFFPACSGNFVTGSATNPVVAPGYSLTYILHDNTGDVIGNVIAVDPSGVFYNTGNLQQNYANQDLAISAYVGPLDAAGQPILSDPCADVALPGTPVRFYKPIELEEISTTCDPVTGGLTVVFTIRGGAPDFPGNTFFEYAIAGDYFGVIDEPGDQVTFTLFDVDGYEIEVTNDGKGCGDIFNVAAPCRPCNNDAGAPQPVQYVCSGSTGSGLATGGIADPGSSVVYYLHSGDVNNSLDSNSNGSFINNGAYPTNTQLYISAAVGPNGADFSDPCTDIQDTGTPVIFLDPVTVTLSDVCDDVTGTTTVSYTVGGGQPAFDSSTYTISGNPGNVSVAAGTHTFDIAEGVGTYSVTATDAAACTVTETSPFDCIGCKNNAGTPNPAQVLCSGATANGTTNGSIVDIGSGLVYALHTGAVTGILATNNTGQFVNDGSYPTNQQLYVSALVGVLGADGLPDLNDPCSDISLPGTPVIFLTPITGSSTTTCDEVTGTTTVTYSFTGGQPAYDSSSYTVSGDATGSATSGQSLTVTIAEGTGNYTVTATDANGCTGSTTGPYDCQGCDNQPGTPNAGQSICAGATANGASNGPFIEEGSIIAYALHDGYGSVGTILATSATGQFTNDGSYAYNTQYYISALVGPDADGDGVPDVGDPCTVVQLPGSPVVFLSPIEGTSDTTCDEVSGISTVTYSFTGGQPAYDSSSYTVSGDATGSSTSGQSVNFTVAEGAGTYTITATDGAGCIGTASGPYTCEGCDNQPGTPNAGQSICAGATANGASNGPFIEEGSIIAYALHDGYGSVGTILATNATGQFTNDGSYAYNTQYYISALVGPDADGDGVPDVGDPCTVVQLPGTPVVFLSPISGTATTTCDDVTGMSTVTYSFTGGEPAYNSSFYTISGDATGTSTSGQSVSFIAGGEDTTYDVTATDGAGCSGSITGPIVCNKEIFDLALIKTLSTSQSMPIYPGDDVTFTITVTNQGTISASNFTITDYIPAGMTLNDTDWTPSGADATITMAGPLAPGGSTSVDITLTVNTTTGGDLVNYAEISSATGVTPNGNTVTDIDSTPDNTNGNDAGGVPNSGTDNTINNEGGDEDDHDPELISVDIFDLAIAKDLAADTPSVLLPGDNVTFVVTVTNEGTVGAQNIDLVDYIPAGLTLNDAAWTLEADGTATNSIPGPIAPGGSASVNITFSIDAGFSGQIRNVVEIAGAEDPNGNMPDDIDSTPGNGDNGEDDVDDAIINVAVFDLALMKVLAPGQASLFVPGDNVIFTITVYNQGTVAAQNVEVIDHIPAGLTLNDAAWTAGAGNTATITIPGPIAAGGSASVNITTTVGTSIPGSLTNFAEITTAQDENGNTPTDVDSTGDNDPTNDNIVDDVTDNSGGDEDDSDIAVIAVGCSNDAGDVPQTPYLLCDGQSVTVVSTGYNLADGASLFYALHDGSTTVGNIIEVNQTGNFVNDGTYTYGVQYYVSAIAASGAPDLSDPCLDVTLPGTPVTFYAPVVITPGAVSCDMVTGEYTASFSVSGGAGSYNVTGDYNGTTTGGSFTFVDVDSDGVIDFTVTDAAGCTKDYNTTYMCTGCDNNPGILQPFNEPICFGDSYGFDAVGASAQSGSVLYYLLTDSGTSIGTIYDANTTGIFIHDGNPAYPTNTPLYVYSAVGPEGPNGYPILSDPCTVTSNPPAQVGFLDPIVINDNYICDNSVGEITVTFSITGGGPSFPGSGHSYTVSGGYQGIVSAGQVLTFGPLSDGDNYVINVVSDGKGCDASVSSGPIQCDKLPIELLSFDGEVKENGNYLKWITASEINNEYFTMERSVDGGNTFVKVGNTIKGAGTVSVNQTYTMLDREAPSGTSLYRLSQTDFDGTTVEVGFVELTRGEASLAILDIYPIPVDNLLNVQISSNTASDLDISITDMLGRVVYTNNADVNVNLNDLKISTESLSAGVYFLTIESTDNLVTKKFVKE